MRGRNDVYSTRSSFLPSCNFCRAVPVDLAALASRRVRLTVPFYVRRRGRIGSGRMARSLPLSVLMQEQAQDQVIARVDLPGSTRADVSLQIHQTRLLITAGPTF